LIWKVLNILGFLQLFKKFMVHRSWFMEDNFDGPVG